MRTREEIKARHNGCAYCAYIDRCHTSEWRDGETCDLFWAAQNDKR